MDEKKLVRVLQGERVNPPPIWLMRQAGRYLPEYRALRAQTGSFWKMCMTPEIACEITLQPIRRFGFDAAIIFSDILTIPAALGMEVRFEEGVGPRLDAVADVEGLQRDNNVWLERLSPVYRALELVGAALPAETALLGFAGAPWTLATYMAQGQGSDDQRAAKLWAYRDPAGFDALIALLADAVTFHLIRQLEAGADAVQIFDSWAGSLPSALFERWVVRPTQTIVREVRKHYPAAKIIGFPRAATLAGYELYARETGVDAVSLDTTVPMDWAAATLGGKLVLQGNLDPIALIAGGAALRESTAGILSAAEGIPFIFNLGHGILPETPVEHVEELIAQVRAA
jgi:uroporphyrinogen decarboxylase